ncbi:Uma2 family endonuclease [Nonomuraea sp. NPDC049152]|uniref:Uma2 family endonuclease n=1 Tax=Nonomuraea sp. NPDC049152 TaxID=3154350 RepID=UPI0033E2B1B8
MSPQSRFHDVVIRHLADALERQAPTGGGVAAHMDVTIAPRQRPRPDLLVIDASIAADMRRTTYTPHEVHLVVEVVSPRPITSSPGSMPRPASSTSKS